MMKIVVSMDQNWFELSPRDKNKKSCGNILRGFKEVTDNIIPVEMQTAGVGDWSVETEIGQFWIQNETSDWIQNWSIS